MSGIQEKCDRMSEKQIMGFLLKRFLAEKNEKPGLFRENMPDQKNGYEIPVFWSGDLFSDFLIILRGSCRTSSS